LIQYSVWGMLLWGQHAILNPSTRLLCWLQKSGPRKLSLHLWFNDLSGTQMGPECTEGLGLESMGSPRVEGSVCLQEDMQQSSRLGYMLPWPVVVEFKWMLDQRNTVVSAQTVKQIWKLYRLLTKCLPGMVVPKGIKWYLHLPLCWVLLVPGHSGMCGNETADEFSRVLFTSLLDQSWPWGSHGGI
jgi:hypothetical protein